MAISGDFSENYKEPISPSKPGSKKGEALSQNPKDPKAIEKIKEQALGNPSQPVETGSVKDKVSKWETHGGFLQNHSATHKATEIAKEGKIVSPNKLEETKPSIRPISKMQTAILKITDCNGSKQEIKKILKEVFPEPQKNIPLLMNVVTTLAKDGQTVKASHLFFFLQFHFQPEQLVENFISIGKSFLEYGLDNLDVSALDCAEFHLAMTRASPNKSVIQEGESLIQKAKACLKNISLTGNEESKKQARNLLDQIQIADLLDSHNRPITKEELEILKTENPDVKKAFELAEALQKRIDTTDTPKCPSKDSKEIQIEDNGQTIPIHTIITGKEQKEGEPSVILEGGLGLIADDWQFVQNLLGDHRTISYDRQGIAWSGKGKDAVTPEKTLSQLELILEKSGLKPPYIFVGHSYGGFLGQLFALKYPDKVKGIVLVDSALETVTPDQSIPPSTTLDYLPPATLRFASKDRGHFLSDKTAFAINTITSKTQHMDTYEEELNSAFVDARKLLVQKLKDNAKPFKCPLKVITAGIDSFDENRIPTEHDEKIWVDWQTGQKELPSRSSSKESGQVFANESDHFIMHYEPKKIADQIEKLFKL